MTGRLAGEVLRGSTDAVLVDRLFVADGWWSRFRGLQFLREFPPGTGLLLSPCASIHMFWVRFPVDLLFLDRDGTVVEVRANVRPWAVVSAGKVGADRRAAVAALELPVGSPLPDVGETLRLRPTDGVVRPLLPTR